MNLTQAERCKRWREKKKDLLKKKYQDSKIICPFCRIEKMSSNSKKCMKCQGKNKFRGLSNLESLKNSSKSGKVKK